MVVIHIHHSRSGRGRRLVASITHSGVLVGSIGSSGGGSRGDGSLLLLLVVKDLGLMVEVELIGECGSSRRSRGRLVRGHARLNKSLRRT